MRVIRFYVSRRPWYRLYRYTLQASLDGGATYRLVGLCWAERGVAQMAEAYAHHMTRWGVL